MKTGIIQPPHHRAGEKVKIWGFKYSITGVYGMQVMDKKGHIFWVLSPAHIKIKRSWISRIFNPSPINLNSMTPVIQTKVVVRNSKNEIVVNGNCYAAAIASMMDLPITDVPNVEVFFPFSDDCRAWDKWMKEWLALKGFKIEDAPEYRIFHNDDYSDEANDQRLLLMDFYYLCSGPSVRGVNHICIYQGGELAHDPHPTREGLIEIIWFEKLTPISPNQ